MADQSELEAALFLLRDFLQREKDRERRGVTLEKVIDEQRTLRRIVETITKDQIATNMRLDRYGRRLRKLERMKSDGTSDPPVSGDDEKDEGDITGKFRAIDEQRAIEIANLRMRTDHLETEKKEEKAAASFWRNWKAQLVAAVVVAMVMGGCGTAGGIATFWLTGGHK